MSAAKRNYSPKGQEASFKMLKSLESAVDKVNTDLTNVDGAAEILGTSSMYTRKLLGEVESVESTKVHGRTFYVIADVEKWAKQREKDVAAKAKASEERATKKAEGTSSRSGPTLKELRAQAKEVGIKKYHHLSKTDLIAAIKSGPTPEEAKTKTEKTEKSGDEPKPPTLAELRKQAKTLAAELGVPTPKGNKAKVEAWLEKAEAGDIKPEAETETKGEDETELTLEDMLSS